MVGYGYQWWIKQLGMYDAFAAMGHNGQRIVVIPDLEIVVVVTADVFTGLEQMEYLNPDPTLEIIKSHIIPAVFSNESTFVTTTTTTTTQVGSYPSLFMVVLFMATLVVMLKQRKRG